MSGHTMGKKKFRAQTAAAADPGLSRIQGDARTITADAFANPLARLGIGQQNLLSASTYEFEPISRNRLLLELAYRGSWIVRQAIDIIPEDMTRAKIKINCDLPPDEIDKFYVSFSRKGIWRSLKEGLKWARLYGGSILIIQVEGQDLSTPLRTETIGKGQFRGLRPLDRWMIQPTLSEGETISDPGPKQGLPCAYDVVVQAGGIPRGRVHHTRVIRFEGDDLPFYQRQMENGWGLSVLEPLWDRLMAFDSTSTGAAQLAFKAHLRTIYIDGFHQAASVGGPAYEGIKKRMAAMAYLQNSEGLSVMDSKEKLETQSYSFAGLDSILMQIGQQVSGAMGIPLVKLFGQSPGGLNSTGESDIRNFYDKIDDKREDELREPLDLILRCEHQSLLGRPPGEDFSFEFGSLWQLNDAEMAEVGGRVTQAVAEAFSAGIIDKPIAMKELNQSSGVTGLWSNITDDDIKEAELEPPPLPSGETVPGVSPQQGNGHANPELEKLHAAIKGKGLGEPRKQPLSLKSSHELELLHHTIKGASLDSISKASADYTDNASSDDRCDRCNHFIKPDDCEVVDGRISPCGWCEYFDDS
jgi:uncharacterized protein